MSRRRRTSKRLTTVINRAAFWRHRPAMTVGLSRFESANQPTGGESCRLRKSGIREGFQLVEDTPVSVSRYLWSKTWKVLSDSGSTICIIEGQQGVHSREELGIIGGWRARAPAVGRWKRLKIKYWSNVPITLLSYALCQDTWISRLVEASSDQLASYESQTASMKCPLTLQRASCDSNSQHGI